MAITDSVGATEYVIVKASGFRIRLKYIEKPKNLEKWSYDSKNDIYYRAKGRYGIYHPLPIADNSGTAKYVDFEPNHWWGGLKLVHVNKPESLDKWHHDDKTDIYYHCDKRLTVGLRPIK